MAAEPSNHSTPKLSLLFSTPPAMKLKYSPQHSSGIVTPPLHTTLASVPFKWEVQPGRPRPYCTDLTIFNEPKCLEPPPRLYYYLDKNTKIPSSPKTVTNGPCNNDNVERGQLGTLVLYQKHNNKACTRGGYWWQGFVKRRNKGTTGGRNKKETGVGGGNIVILPTSPSVKMDRHGRNGSFNSSSQARSHIWASIYEGFNQAIPWKGKESKKEVLIKT